MDRLMKMITEGKPRTAPGPLGTRWEHIEPLADSPEGLQLMTQAMLMLLYNQAPGYVQRAHRTSRLLAKPKKNNEVRPLACGSWWRRAVLAAHAKHRNETYRHAATDTQYGLGKPAGLEVLFRQLQADMEDHPDQITVHLDMKAAFASIDRRLVHQTMTATLPQDSTIYDTWMQGKVSRRRFFSVFRWVRL